MTFKSANTGTAWVVSTNQERKWSRVHEADLKGQVMVKEVPGHLGGSGSPSLPTSITGFQYFSNQHSPRPASHCNSALAG